MICPVCGGNGWVPGGEGNGWDDIPCDNCREPRSGQWEGGTGTILAAHCQSPEGLARIDQELRRNSDG